MKKISKDVWESESGLKFGKVPMYGNSFNHVMVHTKGIGFEYHSVFSFTKP